jgi:hypothetical protein
MEWGHAAVDDEDLFHAPADGLDAACHLGIMAPEMMPS